MNDRLKKINEIARKIANIDRDSERYLLGILEGYSKAYDFLQNNQDFKDVLLKKSKIA